MCSLRSKAESTGQSVSINARFETDHFVVVIPDKENYVFEAYSGVQTKYTLIEVDAAIAKVDIALPVVVTNGEDR